MESTILAILLLLCAVSQVRALLYPKSGRSAAAACSSFWEQTTEFCPCARESLMQQTWTVHETLTDYFKLGDQSLYSIQNLLAEHASGRMRPSR